MTRLLHVVPTYLPAVRYGGPIYSVHRLCKGLAEAGHDVHVFTTNVDGPNDSPVPLGHPTDRDGVQVSYFPSKLFRRLYWSPSMARALAREIDGFDLVHLHSVFLWPTWAAARASRRAGVPYLLSPRGMLVKDLIEAKSRLLKSAWISLVERRNVEAAAAIHVTSDIEAHDLEAFEFKLPEVIKVPNGVDPPAPLQASETSRDLASVLTKDRLILSLGRITWKKGLDRLIESMRHVPDAHLAIVGNDDEGLVAKLARQVRDHGLTERVTFVPRSVDEADKGALFAAAAVFVLPSLSENFANVVLEAMIHGCPVIVSRQVGAGEYAVVAGAGLTFDGTPEDLAAKICLVLGDARRARAMGEAGRRDAEANFCWPVITDRMAACYEILTGNAPHGRTSGQSI